MLSNVSFSSAWTVVAAETQILHELTFVSRGGTCNSLECVERRPRERTSMTVDVRPVIAEVPLRSNGWRGCGWKRWTRVERPRARLTKRRTGRRFPWPSPTAFVHGRPSDAPWDKRRRNSHRARRKPLVRGSCTRASFHTCASCCARPSHPRAM